MLSKNLIKSNNLVEQTEMFVRFNQVVSKEPIFDNMKQIHCLNQLKILIQLDFGSINQIFFKVRMK